jgi:hypothetical protein
MLKFDFLRDNYSADVRMELAVGGRSYPVSRSGPGYAFLREPVSLPAGHAVLAMTIDGSKYVWIVDLKYETAPIDGLVEFDIKSGPEPEGMEHRQKLLPFQWMSAEFDSAH